MLANPATVKVRYACAYCKEHMEREFMPGDDAPLVVANCSACHRPQLLRLSLVEAMVIGTLVTDEHGRTEKYGYYDD